ncbi:RHS repeat-associated core domain-containing protein [Pseudomonas sp. SWRI59]|uniref:RHS repeat-associated core domain-containing protein n=1 Tax=unclassified Pseudomonas TaxID=196821 RepID=UPI00164595E5|nr:MULTISPECIES: RHS repeat-associated core domain-containing protein [unclassified Pseudomonas]MBC3504013.1 RHS repeat-associated core domain-containing protein [Pseudomonas sp. SWRI59]MBC3506948.1 RHS repeat-associated core domain-containing protein [Pseudomonas sp. SWRI68]
MTIFAQPPTSTRFFYEANRLCSIKGASSERILRAQGIGIGQKSDTTNVQLYQLDDARSIIGSASTRSAFPYTPYGGGSSDEPLLSSSFVGQRFDTASGGYPLGNGLRLYKPGIFRFASSDALSPFGKGGFNSYSYCQGDPVNRHDPSGQFWIVRYLLRATRGLIRTATHVIKETWGHLADQIAPGFRVLGDVAMAAASVPTEQSMRARTLILREQPTLQPPLEIASQFNRPRVSDAIGGLPHIQSSVRNGTPHHSSEITTY